LIGEEFSLISLIDGTTVLDTPAIQDHKRAFEGDEGPNTGGMGTISDEHHSLPFVLPEDLKTAHQITVDVMKAIEKETGERYVGVMYGGFIITACGVKLIEYNARFGDPEAFNILPILKTDFVDVCEKAIEGRLNEIGKLEFEPVATVQKYLCPDGYPTNAVKNVPITVPSELNSKNARTFFASVAEENGKLILKGSRAVSVLGMGKNLAEANENCNALLDKFHGSLFYRKDIGTATLIQKRVDRMKKIRN
jgi:phosphoribosylamine--glycine ligase